MEMSKFKKVLDELYSTIEAKSHDYGYSFERIFDEFGATYVAIRLSEKVERLKTIAKGDKAMTDESLEDTLRDIAGYSALALTLLNDRKFAKNYVGKRLEPVHGSIQKLLRSIRNQRHRELVLVLDTVIKKEIEAGNVVIDVTSECTTFDDEDNEICISFTTDNEYPRPIFSIVVIYCWNQQSGTYLYRIKRRTEDSETCIVNGGSYEC